MKIGVLGGSFDPVHYGHLILAEQLINEANLDKVIFVPANTSPFKVGVTETESIHRLNMLKLAVKGNDKYEISDIELKRAGSSYTIDTLKEISANLNEDDELYFILGQDSFMEIQKWKSCDELLKNYAFLIGKRPGESTKELFGLFKELFMLYGQLRFEFFDIPEMDVSSTAIRNKLRAGKSIRYLLPDDVINYIFENNLYDTLIPRLKAFVKDNVKESRYKHTEGVVDTARKMAVRYNEDPVKAEIAAWFHDSYRYTGNLEHGPIAAEKIKELFGVDDQDIINAIKYHTTGHPGMSKLEKIIYISDSLEPGRDYPMANELRKIMYTNLDECLYSLMTHTRDYVKSIGGSFDIKSDEAIKELKEKLNK